MAGTGFPPFSTHLDARSCDYAVTTWMNRVVLDWPADGKSSIPCLPQTSMALRGRRLTPFLSLGMTAAASDAGRAPSTASFPEPRNSNLCCLTDAVEAAKDCGCGVIRPGVAARARNAPAVATGAGYARLSHPQALLCPPRFRR